MATFGFGELPDAGGSEVFTARRRGKHALEESRDDPDVPEGQDSRLKQPRGQLPTGNRGKIESKIAKTQMMTSGTAENPLLMKYVFSFLNFTSLYSISAYQNWIPEKNFGSKRGPKLVKYIFTLLKREKPHGPNLQMLKLFRKSSSLHLPFNLIKIMLDKPNHLVNQAAFRFAIAYREIFLIKF